MGGLSTDRGGEERAEGQQQIAARGDAPPAHADRDAPTISPYVGAGRRHFVGRRFGYQPRTYSRRLYKPSEALDNTIRKTELHSFSVDMVVGPVKAVSP